MDNNNKNKIEEILGSLDNTKRVPVPDFFYTRLKARMEKGFEPAAPKSWMLRPVYALTALVLVLVINTAVILNRSTTADNGATATADTETFQSIAAEYSLNDNSINLYDLNPEK